MSCYTCGKYGHKSRNCPQRKPTKCYNCSGFGHKKDNCPEIIKQRDLESIEGSGLKLINLQEVVEFVIRPESKYHTFTIGSSIRSQSFEINKNSKLETPSPGFFQIVDGSVLQPQYLLHRIFNQKTIEEFIDIISSRDIFTHISLRQSDYNIEDLKRELEEMGIVTKNEFGEELIKMKNREILNLTRYSPRENRTYDECNRYYENIRESYSHYIRPCEELLQGTTTRIELIYQ